MRDGKAHAALVFDGDAAVGWCEYGTPDELPDIYHRKEYEVGLVSLGASQQPFSFDRHRVVADLDRVGSGTG